MIIRNYNSTDYPQVKRLYKQSDLYGGQFDEARDTAERLEKLVAQKPDAILVAEEDEKVLGTVTLFEDGRSAWLYRFAVQTEEVAQQLYAKASGILKTKGHSQVLVYAPAGNSEFENRYAKLGFIKGHNYTAYWRDL